MTVQITAHHGFSFLRIQRFTPICVIARSIATPLPGCDEATSLIETNRNQLLNSITSRNEDKIATKPRTTNKDVNQFEDETQLPTLPRPEAKRKQNQKLKTSKPLKININVRNKNKNRKIRSTGTLKCAPTCITTNAFVPFAIALVALVVKL